MIVSPQKTGTHLMLELALALGYKAFGAFKASSRTEPAFDTAQRLQVARLVFSEEDVRELERLQGTEEFVRRTDKAWSALAWSWQRRLGQPVANRYGQAMHDSVDLIASNPRPLSLDLARTRRHRDRRWFHRGVVRDRGAADHLQLPRPPRRAGVADQLRRWADIAGLWELLRALDLQPHFTRQDVDGREINFALRDHYFLARHEFEKGLWMLHHPAVCKVRYEDLIGPEGGGSKERQRAAVERVLSHLGADVAPELVCGPLYNAQAWSFHKGQPGAWKEAFSSANLRQFYTVYGDLLEQYGYE